VFIEPLPKVEEFVKQTAANIAAGGEQYFVLEIDGVMSGFVRLLKKQEWEGLSWGKWLNTLLYACYVITFDFLKLPKLVFAIRENNARVLHLYKKFQFRRVGSELMVYRRNIMDAIRTVTIYHYEITKEEFDERREAIRKTSLPLEFDIEQS
jgi:hypothetical protein